MSELQAVTADMNSLTGANKSDVNRLDVRKLKTVPIDLRKLSDVVKNDVKKTSCNILMSKVTDIETKNPSTTGPIYKSQ